MTEPVKITKEYIPKNSVQINDGECNAFEAHDNLEYFIDKNDNSKTLMLYNENLERKTIRNTKSF